MLYHKYNIFNDAKLVFPDGVAAFSFSSDLDQIGTLFDVTVAAGTRVGILSDPITLTHPKYGILNIQMVEADVATDYHTIIKKFWIPIEFIDRIS